MWIVEEEAEADVASDLSAFHRIDDVDKVDGPRYFSLAQRLTAYSGVRAAVVAERRYREEHVGSGTQSAGRGGATQAPEAAVLADVSEWVEHVKPEEEG
ncbi:hypothetical protein GKD59_21835 [Parabacteroides distasonis]|uniref:Uncharacterized protein n=1 Tax=Parabacteroides distasonis TaxID=823 RepID=A0A7K0GN76_PARDI|nr:hypothetical protein [Parabacteroides distasonis]MRY60492.1 hypothetical protein [Parabacteroides distasonis]